MPAHSKKGFTLVELLVVISIIAILSVIGVVIFTGVQKSARDVKRRGDIDAIAKAMEVNRGRFEAGSYAGLCRSGGTIASPTYDCSQWFAGGSIPTDLIGTDPYVYHGCDPTIKPNHDPVCGAGEIGYLPSSAALQNGYFDNRPDWMACASLEAGGKYCRKNLQ